MLLITDLTASMSSYVSQLLTWFRLNENKIKAFCFFNDGNKTADFRKEVGRTGGLYFSDANSFKTTVKIAEECMSNMNGGDLQENDIEAILNSISKFKNHEDIILIADNWSNMRDYSLIKEIKKPIHIILCGTSKSINTEYLDLAWHTKGSIHTTTIDLNDLYKVKEGHSFTINNQNFILKNGQFKLSKQ